MNLSIYELAMDGGLHLLLGKPEREREKCLHPSFYKLVLQNNQIIVPVPMEN